MYTLPFTGGFFLLGAILFFLSADKEKKDRRTIGYLIGALLTGGLLGLLFFWLHRQDLLDLSDSYLLAQAVILLLGIFHCWWLYRQVFWSKQDSFWPEALYTLLAALALSLGCLAVLTYLVGEVAVMYWSAGLVFLAPFLLLKAFDYLQWIPGKDYRQKWTFSQQLINEQEWNWVNEMWVSFELRESWNRPGGNRLARFRILAPREAPLGEIFRLAVREYNKQGREIIVQDLGFEPDNRGRFWWLFSLRFVWNRPHTWFPNLRYLDPGDSALVNALRPGDLVKVRRIPFAEKRQPEEVIAVGEVIP